MRHRLLGATVAASALVMFGSIPAAVAAEASGCSGIVEAFDTEGQKIGSAAAPGKGGTQSNPLPIDPSGTITWAGNTEVPITEGSWSVSVAGMPILKGTINNPDGIDQAFGTQDVSAISGAFEWILKGDQVVPVSGELTGTGGSCTASGYVTGTGSPTGAPLFLLGLSFTILGFVLIVITVVRTKVVDVSAAKSAEMHGGAR